MAIVTTDNQHYADIAAAIRAKNGTTTQYTPAEMPAAIQAISGGSEPEPPNDGKTRLYIHVPENAKAGLPPPRADVPLYISQTVANGVSIDWGDGSAAETLSDTGNVNTTHHYNAGGDYVIALTVAEGCELGLGWGSSDYCVMGDIYDNMIYAFMLKKAVIGSSAINIESYAFYQCPGIASVIIPDGIKRIGTCAFFYCTGIASLAIPNTVNSIGSYAVANCHGMAEYHILATTPPTIQSNTFNSIPSDCIIYVPAGTVDAYKAATNWAALADHIQEEPA